MAIFTKKSIFMKDKQGLIRKFRDKKGATQEQMAEHLGISQNAVYKIERGITSIKAEMLKRIATFLDKELDELMEQEEERTVCNVEQHNTTNSVGNIGKKVVYNQQDFEKEREVWQALEKSLRELIDTKDMVIAMLKEKNGGNK